MKLSKADPEVNHQFGILTEASPFIFICSSSIDWQAKTSIEMVFLTTKLGERFRLIFKEWSAI